MSDLTLTTWDWVPEEPRGYVRDLRVRWALEEAELPYRVESISPKERGRHLAHQPFGQIPWLTDSKVSIFESGAILLYLGEHSQALMPTEPGTRAEALSWVIAALNSMEPPFLAWVALSLANDPFTSDGAKAIASSCDKRLQHLETVLAKREWLAGGFSAADILMTEALRLFDGSDVLAEFPACRDYVARATARPAFRKAHADQLAHFVAEDVRRAAAS
jgi:glutathione S-transferase